MDARGLFGAVQHEVQSFDDRLEALGLGKVDDEPSDTLYDFQGNAVTGGDSKFILFKILVIYMCNSSRQTGRVGSEDHQNLSFQVWCNFF